MSELTKTLRNQYVCESGKQCPMPECGCDYEVVNLCDAHEALEAEHERLNAWVTYLENAIYGSMNECHFNAVIAVRNKREAERLAKEKE